MHTRFIYLFFFLPTAIYLSILLLLFFNPFELLFHYVHFVTVATTQYARYKYKHVH